MPQDQWPRVAVMGAGAVGCYFGGMLARAGAPVTLIGRAPFVEAVTRDGLYLDGLRVQERIPVSASTDAAAVRGAAVVLLCVKTPDTDDAARALAPHLDAGAVVISLQNGVDNVERIRAATGIGAVPAVVYVAVAMTGPARVRHTGRGDLILGHATGRDVEALAQVFVRAGVPCVVSDNIVGDLWVKLVMNCAYNANSALGRAKYGRVFAHAGAREVMRQVTDEVVAVAQAAGVRLPDGDLHAAVHKLGEVMTEAMSSTAQDIARGKRTEIDALNGYVARRGAELGVPTPVNATLHALVKLLEEAQ